MSPKEQAKEQAKAAKEQTKEEAKPVKPQRVQMKRKNKDEKETPVPKVIKTDTMAKGEVCKMLGFLKSNSCGKQNSAEEKPERNRPWKPIVRWTTR